jgi:hypothetical protein
MRRHAGSRADLALNALNVIPAEADEWVSTYLGIAEIALRDRSDLQEKIGIKVRNQRTAAQRAASKKNKNGKPPV